MILLVFVVDDFDDIFGYEDQGYPSIFDCTSHTQNSLKDRRRKIHNRVRWWSFKIPSNSNLSRIHTEREREREKRE